MFADIQQKAKELLSENASAILTAGGVVGTVATGILSARAGFKSAVLIQEEEKAFERATGEEAVLPRAERIKMAWPLYLPPVGIGGATITSIILSNRISAGRAAALAAAYGISERRFEEYRAKALERLGVAKEEKMRDEIAQDRVNADPPSDSQVIIIGGDKVLAYDMLTGRWFQTTMEEIRKAENAINMSMLNHEYASLSEFYDHLDLAPTNYTDEVGWNLHRNGQLEVKITTVVSPDGKPALAIDFNNAPHPAYNQLY